jgi:hypothetical protein
MPCVAAANLIAELELNRHHCLRVTLTERAGKQVISISRWKMTPAGERRCGQSLEFGAHRAVAVAQLFNEVLRAIEARGRCAENEPPKATHVRSQPLGRTQDAESNHTGQQRQHRYSNPRLKEPVAR